ncbi:unnamed protein product [marine sediment metagenome]|uniref:Uncharacterized protein n=1 Tax=marine sediment metagenome TaxID=412755 RepID=X0WKQ3_9ZZZZ
MDVRLTWKHALLAVLLAGALVWLVTWLSHRNSQQLVIDAERQAQIVELEDANADLAVEAERAHDDADGEREYREQSQAGLDRAQEAIRIMQVRGLRKAVTVTGCVEERDALRLQNDGLILHNESLFSETLALRREIVLQRRIIENHEERDLIKDRRYDSLKRTQKQQRRKNIWTAVGTNLGSFTIGIGIGRVSS